MIPSEMGGEEEEEEEEEGEGEGEEDIGGEEDVSKCNKCVQSCGNETKFYRNHHSHLCIIMYMMSK